MKTKTITKLVSVNDGNDNEIHNGNLIYIVNYPRTEKILNAFLNDGWILHSKNFRVTPAIQKPGVYSFYLDGWDLLFVKEIPVDQEDDSDTFLSDVIARVMEEESAVSVSGDYNDDELIDKDDDELIDIDDDELIDIDDDEFDELY